MKTPTNSQYENFQLMFDFFNKELFGNRLPCCLLVFSGRGSSVHGNFSKDKWTKSTQKVSEINLNPSLLANSSDKEIASTLVHEMVHLEQALFGQCGTGGYHNKQWAEWMERIGLRPSHNGKPGGNKTGFKMLHYPIKNGLFEKAFNRMPESLILPFRTISVSENPKSNPSKNKVTYKCPKCNSKTWAKPNSPFICGKCFEVLISEGEEESQSQTPPNLTMISVIKVIKLFLSNLKKPDLSDQEIVFQFVESLLENMASSITNDDEAQINAAKDVLYRLGVLLDCWREKGPLYELRRGHYYLN